MNGKEDAKHAEAADSGFAGEEGLPTSTLKKQAGHDANDRAAAEHEPSNSETSGHPGDDHRDGAGSEEDAAPPDEGHAPERIDASNAADVAELVGVVSVPAREEKKSGNTDSAGASRVVEMPQDERSSQEAPVAGGSRPPTPDDDETNEARAGDEAPASTEETDPFARRSKDNLGIELPHDAPQSELPTAEHVERAEDTLGPQDGQLLDTLENDQGAVPKNVQGNELTIELPNDPRYREVLMAEHVEGFVASLGRLDGEQALDGPVAATERGQDPDPEDSIFVETQRRISEE